MGNFCRKYLIKKRNPSIIKRKMINSFKTVKNLR